MNLENEQDVVKTRWEVINNNILSGKRTFKDPEVFQEYMKLGKLSCPGIGHAFDSTGLLSFVVNILTETKHDNDDICLIRAQQILRYTEMPEIELDIDMTEWKSIPEHSLTIMSDIGFNFKIDSGNVLKKSIFKVLKLKSELLDHLAGKEISDVCDQKMGSNKVSLKIMALSLGDGAITKELDLEGNELEGGNSVDTSCYLASVFKSIKETYLDDSSSFKAVIESDMVDKMVNKLNKAVLFKGALLALAPLHGGYDAFEDLVIECLRRLDKDQDILLLATFTQHAVTISIKKTGPYMFEVLLFNSGAGLGSHEKVEIGMDVKYFPAKRYVNLSLAALKRLGVIKKIAELTAVSGKLAPPVQARQKSEYDEHDLYDFALAPLNDYAYTFTETDTEEFKLIPSQRSGVCAYRCLWAYFAFAMKSSFRPIKLLTAKETLYRSLLHHWDDQEWPVARRLLKFGMENYARSVLRYGKRDKNAKALPLKLFGIRRFWRLYQIIKTQLGIKKPKFFKVDQLKTNLSTGGTSSIKADGKAIRMYFDYFEQFEGRITLMKDDTMVLPTSSPKEQAEMVNQIDAVLYVVTGSANWYLSHAKEKLGIMVNYVNEFLPEPTKETDFWNSIFTCTNEDEFVLEKLFKLLQKMLYYQQLTNHVYPSTYAAALKILAIYHKAMTMIDPRLAFCQAIKFDDHEPELMNNASIYFWRFHFISTPVYMQYERMKAFLTKGCNELCETCDLTKSPIGDYLSRYIDHIKWEGLEKGNLKMQLTRLYAQRFDKKVILPHHFYWRDARNFFWTMQKFDRLPKKKLLEDTFSVFNSCRVNGKGSLEVESVEFMLCKPPSLVVPLPFSHQPAASAGMPGIASTAIDYRYNGLDYDKFYETVKSMLLYTDKELALHFNSTFGNEGAIDRLHTLLLNDDGSSGWRVLLTLSTHAINQMNAEAVAPEFLTSLSGFISSELSTQIRELIGERQKLTRGSSKNLKMVGKVGRCSAFLLMLAQLVQKASLSNTVLKQKIREFYAIFDLHETGSDYMPFLAMAYILSHQGMYLTLDMAKKILLVNQRLAESFNVLEAEIDKTRYAFEAQTIVMKALLLVMKGDLKQAKSAVLTTRNDLDHWKVYIPIVELDPDHHVDLLSGDHYIRGFKQSGVGNSEIEEGFKLSKFEPERLKFNSASLHAKEGCKMLHLDVNPLTSKILKRLDGTETILESIKIYYEQDKVFLKEEFSDGSAAFLVSRIKDEWTSIALPATGNSNKPYQIFYYEPSHGKAEVFFEHKNIMTWYTSAEKFVFDEALKNLRFLRLVENAEEAFVNPLADQDTCLLFKDDATYYFLFKYYSDHSGRPLWLRQDPATSRWYLFFDQKYHVSNVQYFAKSEYLHNFLVVENDDGSVRKVIFPVEHYALKAQDKDTKNDLPKSGMAGKEGYMIEFDRKNLDVLKSTVMMSITKEGSLKPSSRYESLLLAYKFLTGREYLDAFTQLLKVHQFEPFTQAELKLLGWIAISFSAIRDGSPDSVAVRAYTFFLVYANNKLFDIFSITDEKDVKESEAPSPYDDEQKWCQYWNNNLLKEPSFNVVESYLNLRSKIPVTLRWDFKTGRDLISQFEERTWIQDLHKNGTGVSDSRSALEAYLNIGDRTTSAQSGSEAIEQIIASEEIYPETCTSPSTYALKKRSFQLSSFHPEKMETISHKLFHHFLYGLYSGYEAESFLDYLYSLKNTKFNKIACKLIDVLEKRRMGEIPEICKDLKTNCESQPAGNTSAINDWKKNCARDYKNCFNYFGKPSRDCKILTSWSVTYRKPKPVKTVVKVIPDGQLETLNLHVANWGDFKNINRLKYDMLHGFLNDTEALKILYSKDEELSEALATVVQSIQESINMGKDSKFPLENEIRRVAKGLRTIDEQDILHLYTHASKRMYYQFFPEVPDSDYQVIHNRCTEYAVLKVHLNDIKRLSEAIRNRPDNEAAWKLELKKRKTRTRTTDNIMMAYEIFINSRLTNRQYSDIKALTAKEGGKFANKVIQRMMSAGKTFILGTILSMLKADKKSLSVLVVPRSLYTSEASSLISRTFNAFGSAGFSFKISRESSEATIERLVWLSEAIDTALKKGKYLIVAPEMLLTMQNRLTEIVLERNPSHSKEFEALQKILKTFRDHGAATFDEIDMIFDPTQELNFPLNSTKHEADEELKIMGTMMAELYITLLEPAFRKIADIRTNITIHPESFVAVKSLLISRIIGKLMKPETMVLPIQLERPLVIFECRDTEAKLAEFFNIPPNSLDRHAETIMNELTRDRLTQNILPMLRMAINDWILTSWSGNVSENYGLSASSLFAIPYASAGVAKEGSEFSFRWLTYVRSIRMFLVLGLDRVRMVSAFNWLQDWALEDIGNSVPEDQSLPFKLSKQLFGKDPFSFELHIPEQMDACLGALSDKKNDPAYSLFLMLWVGSQVIPSVKFYEQQISANAQDFFMMFASIQGYTGTIASVNVLPPVFHPKNAIDLQHKIEIRIKAKVRKDEVSQIIGMMAGWEVLTVPLGRSAASLWEMDDLKRTVASMEKAGHPLNAIIDVGAYFKDESNEAVAESMLKLKPNVLYFSTKLNKLAVKTNNDKEKMIETISRASLEDLGIDDKDRITLYDQQHCTGVDIFQHDRGFALVIIGLKTTTRDFNQAIMRMRKYLEGQKIVIIIPDIIAKTILDSRPGQVGIRVNDVVTFLQKNMTDRIKTQNSLAMSHILRTQYKKPVYDSFLDADDYFGIKCTADDLWVKSTETPLQQQILPLVEKPFIKYMYESLDAYDKIIAGCFDTPKLSVIRKGAEAILSEAVEQSQKNYPATVTSSLIEDNDQMIESEVEAAKMMDLENENEMETQAIFKPLSGTAAFLNFECPTFPESNVLVARRLGPGDVDTNAWIINLRKFLVEVSGFKMLSTVIGNQIYASSAFIKHFFGRNRSYAFYVLWLEDPNETEAPKAIIINSLEAQRAKKQLRKNATVFGYHAWLMTPTGVLIEPSSSGPHVDKQILADVLIFSGFTRILERPEWSPLFEDWLGEGQGQIEKSTIYRNIIVRPFEGKRALLGPLGTHLKISESEESALTSQHEYQKLNFLASNVSAIADYMDRLSKESDLKAFKLLLDMAYIDCRMTGSHFSSKSDKIFQRALTYVMIDVQSPRKPVLDGDDHEKMKALRKHVTVETAISSIRSAIRFLKALGPEFQKTPMDTFISTLSELLNKLMIRATPTGSVKKSGLLGGGKKLGATPKISPNKPGLLGGAKAEPMKNIGLLGGAKKPSVAPTKPEPTKPGPTKPEPIIDLDTRIALEFLDFVKESHFAERHFEYFIPLFKFGWIRNKALSPTLETILEPLVTDPRSEEILAKFLEETRSPLTEGDIFYKMAQFHGQNPGENLRNSILKYAANLLAFPGAKSYEDFVSEKLKPNYPWIRKTDLLIAVVKKNYLDVVIKTFLGENYSPVPKDPKLRREYVKSSVLELYGLDIDAIQ